MSIFSRVELLYDVNLQLFDDGLLTGHWRVVSRALSQADPRTLLARATDFHLSRPERLTIFAALPDEQQPGTWHIQRDELLSRPYLDLTLSGADPTRALITRLRRAPTGHAREMTLYFLTGMEVVLATSSPPASG